jgi:PAS domain S-box-containing protein
MNKQFGRHFSEDITSFFSSGTVILFKCKTTNDFPLLTVSENTEHILGFSPSYFANHEHAWSDRVHPDDKEEVLSHFNKVIEEGGTATHEYRFKTRGGEYIWLRDEIKLIETRDGDELIYGTSTDITKHKHAEQQLNDYQSAGLDQEVARRREAEEKLQRRLEYGQALCDCSELLLLSSASESLQKSLQVLQEVTGADHVFLYRNSEVDEELSLDPVVEVTAERVDPVVENTTRTFKYSDIPWFYEKLSAMEKVHARVEDLPAAEQAILQEQDVQSLLIIPFAVEGTWKGYIGFSDTRYGKIWDEEEVSFLETVSRVFAAFEKRKEMEQSLVEQRNYTNAILDNLPSIYLLMDTDLQLVRWNSFAETYTGYSEEELKAKDAFDLIASDDHEIMGKAIKQVREDHGMGTELKLKRKSGETVPYHWSGYFIELNNKKFFLCIGVDITYQKETEKELRHEKRFNEALLESLPGIFYMFDEEGNYHRWNQNLLDQTGYTKEDMQQITPDVFFGEEELDAVQKEIGKVFEVGHAEMESKLKTKDGSKIPYYLTGKLFEVNGNEYLLGVGHDISKQVKARKELQKNEALFHNLFLKAPAAIVMVGPENKVKEVNQSFEQLFEYSKEEIKGQNIDKAIVPPGERDKVPSMPVDDFHAEHFNREAKRITKSGEIIDVFIAAIPVYFDNELIAGFGMYIDITEEKKNEEEIARSLKEKKVMLKEIHHRVKNNLAIVSGLLQLQMYESDDPQIHDTLEESERRIQTMALIHEQLYNSESLESISCDTYIGDLIETIKNTIGSSRDVTVNADIESIELDIKQAVPFALLINEVVTNSFKHAFDVGKDNAIAIRITEYNGKVQAHLSDNGKGLPDDLQPEMSDTLGMNLINNFAQQLEAEWEMGNDNGTYINLQFSIKRDRESPDSI